MEKHIIKIGIDVATNISGFAVFYDDKLIHASNIISKEFGGFFKGDKVSQDAVNIQGITNAIVIGIYKHLTKDKTPEEIQRILKASSVFIALEVSNHANKTLAQKLGVYAGMFATILSLQFAHIGFSFIRENFHLKFVNPNEWKLRAFGKATDRELGKAAAIAYVNNKFFGGKQKLNIDKKGDDDIADAIIIASLAIVLRDNFSIGQARHIRKDKKTQNKAKIAVLTTKLTNLKMKLMEKRRKHLDKIGNAKKSKFSYYVELMRTPTDFANQSEMTRYYKYLEELKTLEADIDLINKFEIKGKTNG